MLCFYILSFDNDFWGSLIFFKGVGGGGLKRKKMPCHFIRSKCSINVLQVLSVVIQSHTGFLWVPRLAIKNQKVRVLMFF